MKIKEVIFHLSNVYNGKPWYGKSIRKILSDAHDPDRKMVKIAAHMLAWREYVLRKVQGEDYTLEINSQNDWPEATDLTMAKALKEIEETNEILAGLLSTKKDEWLRKKVAGTSYNFQFLLEGIIQHDIYHLGQIAILQRIKDSVPPANT